MTRLVFDIDGTLCFDGRTIDPEIVAALEEASRDHTVVFASARSLRDLLPVLPESLAHLDLVGGNGALRRCDGQVSATHLSAETRSAVDALIAEHGLRALIDGDWDYSYAAEGTDPDSLIESALNSAAARNLAAGEIEGYTKVLLFTGDPAIRATAESLDVEITEHSGEPILDLTAAGVTKASGIAHLWGPETDFVAFGNDANDISMFEAAVTSYCVGGHVLAGERATYRITREQVAESIRAVSAALV